MAIQVADTRRGELAGALTVPGVTDDVQRHELRSVEQQAEFLERRVKVLEEARLDAIKAQSKRWQNATWFVLTVALLASYSTLVWQVATKVAEGR